MLVFVKAIMLGSKKENLLGKVMAYGLGKHLVLKLVEWMESPWGYLPYLFLKLFFLLKKRNKSYIQKLLRIQA